ncbi:E3 ubiquitin-protein ligase TRIM47-like isoform X2 [Acipenser ruthenus]|uniref:E3 ubiquitin-protein ligase TRIM47-like isoform X2 n=1 Tax=Acipenser ruthenus TaxID=7906 RepID=UPI0027425057|nr:E3 ubiquitin-protein ligase TRIM47-like isoform X2 [Acipenser ruthenus]
MASKVWSEDRFSCSVCLEILKDPVAIPCGHSYCMGCIKNYWDQTDHTGVYSCPQCRKTFTPRPDLCRNTMLAELVEELKKTGLNPPPAQSYAGPGDVPCDVCTGRKFKAVKSCLTCLASYCETHVKPHYEGAAFKRHKLINAIGNLEQKLCAEHQKVLEGFCRTDQTCICWLCAEEEHKGHDIVSAGTGKQKQLGETQTEIQQRIQERLKEIEELKQAVETLKRSACIEIKESEKIFTELIRSIEKIHTEVIELIGANEKAAVNQAEGRMKKLEQEIAELRRRNAELKQLSETEDHIHFLQNFQSLCAPPEAGDLPSVTVNTDISFGAVRKAVSELKDHIEDFCKGELVKITTTGWCETDSFGREFSNRPWLEEGHDLQDINKDLLQIVGYMNIAAGRMVNGGGSREEGGGSREEGAWKREEATGRRKHGRRSRKEGAGNTEEGLMKQGGGSREEGVMCGWSRQ